MAALLIPRTVAFDIDAELDSLLNNLSNDDLHGFAEAHSNLTNFDEIKLNVYANVLIFRRTGLIEYLEEASLRTKRWVQQTPDNHPERALQQRILVQIFGEIARHKLGSTWPVSANNIVLVDQAIKDDVKYAIEVATVALDRTPRNHPDRVAISNDLAAWFAMQFMWTDELKHLSSAIEVATDALSVIPRDHPYRYMVLTNFGTWICMRYNRTRSFSDINQAIELAREALELTPEGHHDKAMAFITLGSRLDARFQKAGWTVDLDNAIEAGEFALAIMPQDHPERPNTLINLAARLGKRFEQTRSEVDLTAAIDFARTALHVMPQNHHARSRADQNFHILLSMQFNLLESTTDHRPIIGSHAGVLTADTDGLVAPPQTKQMDTKLDFESSPPLSEIQRVVGIASLDENGNKFKGRCRVYWDILEFCKLELKSDVRLHTVVTLTGTPMCAEANTCEEFVKKIWGSSTFIDFIDAFAKDPVSIQDPFKLHEDCYITIERSNHYEKQREPPCTCFSISGPLPEVAQLFQELAWLTAAFTLPTERALMIATATLEVIKPGLIEINSKKLATKRSEPDSSDPEGSGSWSCWYRLMKGATLAYGFPTSEREEGIGLEIPLDLMTGLADIRTQIDVGEGATLFGGAGVVLYPTKILKSGVQWHCAGVHDDDYVMGGSGSTAILKKYDMNQLSGQRTFLGYFTQAEVRLGTKDLVTSHTTQIFRSRFPDAATRIEYANEGTFASGFSVKGIFTLNFAAKYQLSKTLRISLEGRTYLDMVDEAEQQSTIIYDGETKSAWLVSELSVVLHIALLYLSRRRIQERRQPGCQTLDGNWPLLPYANPLEHGFEAARKVCILQENCKIKLWEEGNETKTFADVIQGILRDFRQLRDGVIVQRKATTFWPQKPGLRGWEYADLLTRRSHILQKEVPHDEDHVVSWWELGNAEDVLVLLGRDFGSLISPRPESKNPIQPENIPPGSRLLIASKPCIPALKTDENSGFSIGSLEWTSVRNHPSSCNWFCNRSCHCIQILEKRPFFVSQRNLNKPRGEVLKAQAVIFGESKYYHHALELRSLRNRGH